MIIIPKEMEKIYQQSEPYKVRKGLSWYWADNTPQYIIEDEKKFATWFKKIFESYESVGCKI